MFERRRRNAEEERRTALEQSRPSSERMAQMLEDLSVPRGFEGVSVKACYYVRGELRALKQYFEKLVRHWA